MLTSSIWHKTFSGEVCKVVLPWRGLGLMRSCFDAGSASSLLCRTRCKYSNRSTDKQTRACVQREDPPVTISTTVLWGYGVAAASPCRSCGNLLVMYGSQARSGIHAQPSKGVLRQGESANLVQRIGMISFSPGHKKLCHLLSNSIKKSFFQTCRKPLEPYL